MLVPATGFHVAAVAITGWDSLGGAPGLADVASLLFVHVIAATAFAHLVATWIGEDSAANAVLNYASNLGTYLPYINVPSRCVGGRRGC